MLFHGRCLSYGASFIPSQAPDGASGPLFYTGQTWLGITIRTSYSFFGVKENPPPTNETSYSNHGQDYDEETGLLRHNYKFARM